MASTMCSRCGRLILLCILTLVSSCGPGPLTVSDRSTGPYLQMDDPGSIIIAWFTPEPQIGQVEVLDAASGAVIATLSEPEAVEHHAVRVTLPATGTYEYRLIGPAATDTQLHMLRAPPSPGKPLRFAVIGDTGSGLPEQYAVAEQILAIQPDYVLHAGDVVYPGGKDVDYDRTFFIPYASLLPSTVFLPCLGNHDVGSGSGDGFVYVANFILPQNGPSELEERCYSITLGDVQLASIDRTRPPDVVDEMIIPWLRETFSNSTATWRFLLLHYPVYQSGGPRHPIVPADVERWAPLCDELKIDLCLTGHNHFYERTLPIRAGAVAAPGEGTVYIVSGNGGQLLYPFGDPAPFSAAHNDQINGFVRIDVNGRHLQLAEIDQNGQQLDAAEWEKP